LPLVEKVIVVYYDDIMAKRTTKSTKRTKRNDIEGFEPARMTVAVASLAVVSLVLFGLVAVTF